MITVRRACPEDIKAITEIYNEAIAKTVATFDTAPVSVDDQQRWLAEHGGKYPVMVPNPTVKLLAGRH